MIQEEKQLLLKDLCARLPYGVKINHIIYNWEGTCINFTRKLESFAIEKDNGLCYDVPVEEVRPYLRPMSSMTEEEREEIRERFCYEWEESEVELMYYSIEIGDADCLIDWFLKHHLDFRGLIHKGLALEASKDMYKQ